MLVVLGILLGGCASQAPTVDVSGLERSSVLRVEDLRPETERRSETFSYSISSDAYAIYRLEDGATNPSALRLLQHRAFEQSGGKPDVGALKVRHLVVYRNLQAEFRRTAVAGALGGTVGAVLVGPPMKGPDGTATSAVDRAGFEALGATEYKRGIYSAEENPDRGSVHVVYIETEIGGKRVFTRTVGPVKGKDGNNALSDVVDASIKAHLSQYL
ncbi:hypothetical protein [Piscinibacter gummiphilus]|uniref:Uncharacterized protein n=2 Tax=Piscinibacter gummiphilus TaxID=946333 RepID=A0A1W6L7K4_9BURK|nr:hypothetical protein [Piscinibacter gummiphilus]ARN20187.1 hypothetical protein A4W93_09845 [Piscinibacter gummiphilus]ATU64856.1 hypothetical protein CPZ87_09920 [Piscinibacter gummiphilus]